MAINVAIVEDNDNLRIGMSYILRSSPGFQIIGEYEDAEDFFREKTINEADVVLMDIGLPGMSGIDATRQLKISHPRIQVVILSVFEDDENIFQAICAGACGYMSKPVMPAQLTDAVEQAFAGASPMSPHIARKVVEIFRQFAPPPKVDYNLTDRELEVLELLTHGLDLKVIANKLFVSPFTIRAHVRNIYDKLHVHSKSEAVAKALKERLITKK